MGLTGMNGHYPFNMLTRFLLPELRSDFAEKGDLLEIVRAPSMIARIALPANLTRRCALSVDPWRARLCAAIILALPLPSVLLGGRWWLLIVSALVAALFLYDLHASGLLRRRVVVEEGAAMNIAAWRIIRPRTNGLPPGYEIREEPEPDWVDLLDLAYAGKLEHHETIQVADLPVPDGKLLACEPFQIHDPRPHMMPVPPGTYPVSISVASSPDGSDQRIAYAWVRLRDGTPARWEPARTRRGEEVSVGVDSGMACFTSAAAAVGFIAEYDHGGGYAYNEPLSDTLVKAFDEAWRDTRGWAVLESRDGARLAAFSSGFGDGAYPVYRALDSRGRRLAVGIIFYVDW
jgi:hypothetical protein